MAVGEGDRVKVADSARPERLGNDRFADVEILWRLVRTTAKAAAIDEERFAFRSDQEQRVSLAYIDRFHEQGVAGVIDGTGSDGSKGRKNQCSPG
jgi:hypothetical protein